MSFGVSLAKVFLKNLSLCGNCGVFQLRFEAFFGGVIISNSIFLGIQVQMSSLSPGGMGYEKTTLWL